MFSFDSLYILSHLYPVRLAVDEKSEIISEVTTVTVK